MKHLRRIFENSESIERYVEDCFLDITENSNFEVNKEVHIPDSYERTLPHNPDLIYILNILLGKSITLPLPIGSNLYIGKVETSLDFLRMKNDKLNELYDDIEVAINRVVDKFSDKADIKVKANRRDEIDIIVTIKK